MDAEQKRLEFVGWLRSHLTRVPGDDLVITHSLDTAMLEDPPLIDGEQPDLLAQAGGGKLIIGLAKTGPEFSDEQSVRQYQAFGSYRDPETGEDAVLNLAVLAEFKVEAEAALKAAGLTPLQFHLVGIGGLAS